MKADQRRIQELCQELTDVLSKKGLVTHLMSDSNPPGMIISYNTHEMRKHSTHGSKHTECIARGRHCEGSDHLLLPWFKMEPQIGPGLHGARRILDGCCWMVDPTFETPVG